jgi:hypothetical protein
MKTIKQRQTAAKLTLARKSISMSIWLKLSVSNTMAPPPSALSLSSCAAAAATAGLKAVSKRKKEKVLSTSQSTWGLVWHQDERVQHMIGLVHMFVDVEGVA